MTSSKRSLPLILAALLLLGSVVSLHAKASNEFNPETNEGYFILPQEETFSEYIDRDIFLLQFEEDGHRRSIIAFKDNDFEFVDAFSGEIVFRAGMNPYNFDIGEIYWISEKYFREGTVIQNFVLDNELGGHLWFWGANPDRSPSNYFDLRAYYEAVFPPDQRFPRKQIIPVDHPASRIPRDRDHLPLTDFPIIVQLTLKFENRGEARLFAEVRSREETIDKKVTRTDEYYELFSGTWLHTRIAVDNANKKDVWDTRYSYQVNEEYLQAQFSGRKIVQGLDYAKKQNKVYFSDESWFFHDGEVINHGAVDPDYDGQYENLFRESRTIGDLRRIYEMLPRQDWFIPAVYKTPVVPAYDPPGKSFRPVSDAKTLQDALTKAKNGDTIIVLCDIRLDHRRIDVKNKKITIRGVEGQRPHILWDIDTTRPDISTMSILTKANVLIENLCIEATFASRCFSIWDKSILTLGKGSEVTGFGNVVKAYNGSKFVLDGAYIHHNTGAVFICNGYAKQPMSKMHLISGEIAYNHSDWITIDASDFIMDGGSIHHNSAMYQFSILWIHGKGEINGGKINDNFGFRILWCDGGTIKMTGGEINRNTGIIAGGISVNNYVGKASFLMTDGNVHDNLLCLNSPEGDWSDKGALNVFIEDWYGSKSSSFSMSGGSIHQSLKQGDIPSIVVYGQKGNLTLSKNAQVDINSIVLSDGGKLQNKLKNK